MSWQAERQIETVPAPEPKTIADAIKHMHDSTDRMARIVARLERLLTLERQTPELRTVVINPAASAAGPFVTVDRAAWTAKSVGVLNLSPQPVSIGIAGVSTASNSGAPQCPANAAIVLPVEAGDLEFGAPAALGAASLVLYVFRYVTVQPLLVAAT